MFSSLSTTIFSCISSVIFSCLDMSNSCHSFSLPISFAVSFRIFILSSVCVTGSIKNLLFCPTTPASAKSIGLLTETVFGEGVLISGALTLGPFFRLGVLIFTCVAEGNCMLSFCFSGTAVSSSMTSVEVISSKLREGVLIFGGLISGPFTFGVLTSTGLTP